MDSTLGPIFGGGLASTILYGITIGQTCRYFMTYPEDGLGLKVVVGVSLVLETLTQFLLTHAMWFFFILKGDGSANPVWSYSFCNVPTGLVICIVQCFYTQSLWCLGQKKFAILLVLGAVFEFLIGIVYLIIDYVNPALEVLKGQAVAHEILVYAAIVCSVLTDVGITISMCRALLEGRSSSEGKSKSVINTIITWTLATGALVTVTAVVYMIIVITLPTTSAPNGFYFAAAKLYVNSMLASLNNRESLRDRLYSGTLSEFSGYAHEESPI